MKKTKKMKNNNQLNKEITLSAIAELIEASAKKTSAALEAKIEASAKKTIETLEAKIEQSAENLATMTQNQFLEIDARFDSVDKRFDSVDKRLDNVEIRLAGVEMKVDRIEGEIIKKVDTVKYNTTKYRVKKLEEKFA